MHKLTHFRLCPHSRSLRILLAELGIEVEAVEERPWEWRPQFLALNPAGALPVLELEGGPILCGTYAASEFIADELATVQRDGRAPPLFPGNREERAEVRRLVDWFHGKLHREVTDPIIEEKLYARLRVQAPGPPNVEMMRSARANLRYHLTYIAWLVDQRRWLAGDEMSFADLAAGAHLSCLDYLDEMPWEQHPAVKGWYVRIKSRKSFRTLLNDRLPGVAPPVHYTDLDF